MYVKKKKKLSPPPPHNMEERAMGGGIPTDRRTYLLRSILKRAYGQGNIYSGNFLSTEDYRRAGRTNNEQQFYAKVSAVL